LEAGLVELSPSDRETVLDAVNNQKNYK